MAARNHRNRPRRRRGRFGFLYKLLSFLIILAAITAGCVAFFRVNQVEVEGNSRYTVQEVIDASGVEIGDNLFLINRPQTALSIMRRLPYVEKASVVPSPPDTLVLRITESSAVASIQAEGSWWLVNADGKLLEQSGNSGGLPEILGLPLLAPAQGTGMAVEESCQSKLDSLCSLLSALKGRGMEGQLTEFIDLSVSNAIYFGYGADLTVVVPMTGDFEKRIFSLQRVMETFQERGETVTGTLDLTYGDEQARLLTSRWTPETGQTVQKGEDQNGSSDGSADAAEPDASPSPAQ